MTKIKDLRMLGKEIMLRLLKPDETIKRYYCKRSFGWEEVEVGDYLGTDTDISAKQVEENEVPPEFIKLWHLCREHSSESAESQDGEATETQDVDDTSKKESITEEQFSKEKIDVEGILKAGNENEPDTSHLSEKVDASLALESVDKEETFAFEVGGEINHTPSNVQQKKHYTSNHPIWRFFTTDLETERAQCKFCPYTLSFRAHDAHRHLSGKHKEMLAEYQPLYAEWKQKYGPKTPSHEARRGRKIFKRDHNGVFVASAANDFADIEELMSKCGESDGLFVGGWNGTDYIHGSIKNSIHNDMRPKFDDECSVFGRSVEILLRRLPQGPARVHARRELSDVMFRIEMEMVTGKNYGKQENAFDEEEEKPPLSKRLRVERHPRSSLRAMRIKEEIMERNEEAGIESSDDGEEAVSSPPTPKKRGRQSKGGGATRKSAGGRRSSNKTSGKRQSSTHPMLILRRQDSVPRFPTDKEPSSVKKAAQTNKAVPMKRRHR